MDVQDIITIMKALDWQALALFFNAGVLAIGFVFTWQQLHINKHTRVAEDRISISKKIVEHNNVILEDENCRKAVAFLEGLNVPINKAQADIYWAYRGVHLNHINLVWQVWEIGRIHGKGGNLEQCYAGWERFAKKIIATPLYNASLATGTDAEKPEIKAAADLWKGMSSIDIQLGMSNYEAVHPEFFNWLKSLVEVENQKQSTNDDETTE